MRIISSPPLTTKLLPPFFYPNPKPIIATSIHCFSTISNMFQSPETTDNRRKKVVVCGGGVIGVCTAYFLAKNGADVTVIEQSSIACAASGKAGGFLALDWCDSGPLSSLARTSFNLHRSLSDELDGPSSYGYRPLTTLSVSIDESENGPSSRVKNLPPWVDGPAQNSKPIGSVQTTAQVHPYLFTRCLMTTAMEKYGADVMIGKAEQVEFAVGRVDSVILDDGRVIKADSVVFALGPWSSKLAMLSSMFRIYGLKAHSIILEPKEPDIISPHALFLTYYPAEGGKPIDPEVYPRPTGDVYICGMSAREEVPDDPEQVAPNPESIRMLKQVAGNVSKHLKEGEAQVKAEQACFLPSTDDGIPVIGKLPGMEGCFVATGHSCWGILNGPATGAALAELVMDGQASIVDLSQFSPARFAATSKKR